MSHHYAGPDFGFPNQDARLNLTDLYAFPEPGAVGRSIIVLNVHPSSTLNPQVPTTREPFSTEALYEIRVDTNGDAVADITYQAQFSPTSDGSQTVTLRRLATGRFDTRVIVEGAAVSMGREARIASDHDHRLFAGWRSDPFFFDPLGALNNLQFTGKDFFTDKDVCSIVLSVPNSTLGMEEWGLWGRVLQTNSGGLTQVDRTGRPAQGVFLVGDQGAAYGAAEPAGDSRFIPVFAHSLEHSGGYSAEEARKVASALLPDILRFDPARPASFPNNGRNLTDDVQDLFLSIFTNGKVTSDRVGPHGDLLAEFPYLGPPHG